MNSKGKYDKILKAVKFDLVNEKIIEIDLNKEKIECLPEKGINKKLFIKAWYIL